MIAAPLRAAPIALYIDADACPVKEEAYKVGWRHAVRILVVANAPIAVPAHPLVERVLVPAGPDAADDFIAARVARGDVVVTADVPLAARCVKAGADVIAPTGKPFTTDSIGMALATRNLMDDLRSAGAVTGGPRPFSARDRSAFLSALDLAVVRLKRAGFATGLESAIRPEQD
ncbi:YaiI/YqxD family protein [Xanthobacter sp. V2C-8]|uniref:YaiI/YqxD family protein n=1 Tax=Xanthobacter albus TaxID=3119929 RepID=UPI0037283D5E